MLIGIPKEIKNNENRVALTPAGVHSLVGRGHRVLIETNAGLGSGFTDADYQKQGAEIVSTAGEAWAAELVVKVKEPLDSEYGYLRDDLLLFTYLHMAAAPELADAMLEAKTTGIAYETVRDSQGQLPRQERNVRTAALDRVEQGLVFQIADENMFFVFGQIL